MTRPKHLMTEAQRAAYDAYHASQRKTDRPVAPRMDPADRMALAYLAHMDLWPKAQVASVFGVSRKALHKAMTSYPRTSRGSICDATEDTDG